ncbi:hypothetical protein [Pseudonocardia kongjuensis]
MLPRPPRGRRAGGPAPGATAPAQDAAGAAATALLPGVQHAAPPDAAPATAFLPAPDRTAPDRTAPDRTAPDRTALPDTALAAAPSPDGPRAHPAAVAAPPLVAPAPRRPAGPLREAGTALARRRGPVALLAAAAAAGAAALALLFPPPVVVSTSVQIGAVGVTDPGPATARGLAAATSAAFTDRVAALSGRPAADVADRLAVTAPVPGVLDVRVTGPDTATATAVADDAVTALRERVAVLDSAVGTAGTDPLRAELDRIAAAPPDQRSSSSRSEPDPVSEQLGRALADRIGQATVVLPGPDPVVLPGEPPAGRAAVAAVLGGLAVLLGAAIAIPAVRRGRRLLPESDPAGALAGVLDVPVLAPGPAPDAIPALAAAYRASLREMPVLTVLQLTAEPACDIASELVKAAALVGDRREYADLTPGAAPAGVAPGAPVVRALRVRRPTHEDLCVLRDGGPTVLAVQTAGTRAEEVVATVAALRAVGAPPVLCLVWPGRLPRDPARTPLPADARTRADP